MVALQSANDAKADFAKNLDLNGNGIADNAEGSTHTAANVKDTVDSAVAGAMSVVDGYVDGDYSTNSSPAVRAALLSDQEAANQKDLTNANKAVDSANAEIAKVAGLKEAVATYQTAVETHETAVEQQTLKGAELSAAEALYNGVNDKTITIAGDGSVTDADGDLIVLNSTTNKLELATGVTEATKPGITAILNASQAKLDADKVEDNADKAKQSAEKAVSMIDLDAAGKLAQSALAEEMGLAATAQPTQAQIDTKVSELVGLLQTEVAGNALADDAGIKAALADPTKPKAYIAKTIAEVAASTASGVVEAFGFVTVANAGALTAGEIATARTKLSEDLDTLIAAIKAAFDSDNTSTKTAVEGFLTQAVTDGLISAVDKVEILTDEDWAAIGSDQGDIETFLEEVIAPKVNGNNNSNEFEAAVGAYEKAQDIVDAATNLYNLADAIDAFETTAAASNPLLAELQTQQDEVKKAEKAITDLAEAVAKLQALEALQDQVTKLDKDIADATKAITDMEYVAPVTVGGADKNATAASDLYVVGDTDGTINNFGLLGEDALFIGKGFTVVNLTETQVIGDNLGNASALEVFVKQVANDTFLYIEEETFGGNSSGTTDIVEIKLAGVNAEDLVFTDGMFTVA